MTAFVVAMVAILTVAAATAALVLVGIEGRGKLRAPRLADRAARAAEHLNGDAQGSYR